MNGVCASYLAMSLLEQRTRSVEYPQKDAQRPFTIWVIAGGAPVRVA